MALNFLCLVCGWQGLEEDPNKIFTFEICSCCGVHYGDDVRQKSHIEERRLEWLSKGAPWFSEEGKPDHWSKELASEQITLLKRNLKIDISEKNIIRVLIWFQKDAGDELVGEEELQNICLRQLQLLFGISKDDPMYDHFPINMNQVAFIQQYVKVKIQIDKYDYFVTAYSRD